MQIKRTKDTILFTYLIMKMLLKANGEFQNVIKEHLHIQQSENCINFYGTQFGNCCYVEKKILVFSDF